MKSTCFFKTLNSKSVRERRARVSTPEVQKYLPVILGSLLFALSTYDLHAQVANQNPAGHAGIFNGQVNTGCSYDPYTGNATRSITDIAVAGGVGEYPLALVRTANSRAPSTTEVFGWAGGWNHSYNWILEESEHSQTQNFHPVSYTVEFPDGRVETFKDVTWDAYRRVRRGADGSAGVRERFVQLDLNTMFAYLILPDGGKIEFKAVRYTNASQNRWWYKYHATAIYDPYGLKTQLVSSTTPNGLWRHLDWVIEPAGRSLHFLYTGPNNPKIHHVDASDGRTVNYYYLYCNGCRLSQVTYYNNANWTARYQYRNSNVGQGLPPLLWTADDPMYAGPMKRIAYDYKPATPNNPDGTTPVYGQILRERYWDGTLGHETSGSAVSTLTVGEAPNHTWIRTETRGDSATRAFVYNSAGRATWASDFMGHQSTMAYDAKKYLNSFIDFNRNETNYTNDPITGNVTQIKYPLTQGDTPGQNQQPTVNYTYTNSYYLNTTQGEGGFTQTTTVARNGNNRITQVTYPDGGYETFTYNGYGQVLTHRMTTGGTESFTYNWTGSLKDTYRNPDNPTGNPTVQYFYDGHGWVNGVFDAVRNPTNWTYNDRGQVLVTTLPTHPVDGQRHTITNAYNPDGTLQSKTNELGFVTSYAYDDYRRLASVTPPDRGDGTGTHPTSYVYYDWIGRDYYTDTNAQPSWVVFPSGKLLRTIYDANWRKSSETVGYGSGDDATTSYLYDGMGNVTWLTNPRGKSTAFYYDERNRSREVHDADGKITSFKYDTAGRKKSISRPNGQAITYNTFDVMNRVTQQTVTQSPDPEAVTKYAYYTTADGQTAPVGLLKTMTDPHNTTEVYKYTYDLMGRKLSVTYPLDSLIPPSRRVESFQYDPAGRLWKFTNRDGKTQTFNYDALNRLTYFTWTNNTAPRVDFGYDAASRPTSINNVNATISRLYWNDNSPGAETETPAGGSPKTVMYFYDADGNRDRLYMPGYTFQYQYTGRNQLSFIKDYSTGAQISHYVYDENGYTGNLTTRTLANATSTTYLYDALDRVTHIEHSLNVRNTRTLDNDYDSVGDRKWTKRDGGTGDVFGYDFEDQVTAVKLNVANPSATPPGTPTIVYDANGNLRTFQPYGPAYTYTTNYLNQYTQRNAATADYDKNGNMKQGFDGSAYTFDAQNRLLTAPSMSFKYDGLNRQVSRTANGVTTYSVWDGWNLVQEYHMSGNNAVEDASYVYGPTGLVKELLNNRYYYQDGSGSTSHLASSSGSLLEWYRYDLQGTPIIYDANNTQRTASAYNVRHLFTGQQWYSDIGLYDLRNRFYSPDIGRFLQPDPIGFRGDRTNLYRYCRNNPVTRWDPSGLEVENPTEGKGGGGVTVYGDPIRRGWAPGGPFGGGLPFGGASGEPGIGARGRSDNPSDLAELERINQVLERLSNELSAPPPQSPPSPGDQSNNPATSSTSPTQAQITSQILQAVVVTFPFGGQYMPMTPIKNSAQARRLGRRLFSRVPIFVPPGENPQATVNRWARTIYPFNLPSFGLAFRFKGPNDFAYNVSPIFDAYGNFIYGYSGWTGGIPPSVLQFSAAAVKGGFNDPVNVYDIELGIDAAMMGGTISVVAVSDSDF